MRISINGSSELLHCDVARLVAHAKQASEDGMAGWWLAQTGLIDALTVLALAADAAPDIELGTAVNATFPITRRHWPPKLSPPRRQRTVDSPWALA